MPTLPANAELLDPAVTQAQFKAKLGQTLDFQRGLLGSDGTAATARAALGLADVPLVYPDMGAWTSGTNYNAEVLVSQGGIIYRSMMAHIAGVFATDYAAGKWIIHQGATKEQAASVGAAAGAAAAAPYAQTAADKAVIATTQAGVSTAQAVLSDASRVQAQAARDAANVNGKIYATTAAGLAATTTGQYFSVPSALSNEHLILYLNSAGAAVEQKRYPSSSQLTTFSKGFTDLRNTVDLLTTLTWSVGILEANGTVLGGYGCSYSSFLAVTPRATVIKLVCTNNYDTIRPNILGYDINQNPIVTVFANGTVNATAYNPAIIPIPDGVYYIKIAAGVTPALAQVLSIEDKTSADIYASYLDTNSGNYFKPGLPNCSNTGAISAYGNGTGYVPVQIGDTIRYRGIGYGSWSGVCLYDSAHVFLRFLFQSSPDTGTVYTYTLNALDDANVAFAVASDIYPSGLGFFTVERAKNSISKIKDITDKAKINSIFWRDKAKYFAYTAASTVTNNGKYDQLSFISLPSYVTFMTKGPSEGTHTKGLCAVKLQLVSLPVGVTQATASWYAYAGYANSGSQVFNLNDTFILWNEELTGASHLMSSVAGAVFSVIDSTSFRLDATFWLKFKQADKMRVMSDPRVFDADFEISSYAQTAFETSRLVNGYYGKKLVFFGDSILASFATAGIVADALGMTLVNLAVGGSTPFGTSNLSDANLAAIPVDAAFVIISGGANAAGSVPFGTISTRDRTTMEGCINFAMDWIYTNRPSCRIMLATPPTRSGASLSWAQVFRDLSVYRKVPLADVDRFADINANNFTVSQYDGVHPTAEGIIRHASVLIGAMRSVIY